jgi:DNA-binding SARP family transcriptional activator
MLAAVTPYIDRSSRARRQLRYTRHQIRRAIDLRPIHADDHIALTQAGRLCGAARIDRADQRAVRRVETQ